MENPVNLHSALRWKQPRKQNVFVARGPTAIAVFAMKRRFV